MEAWPSFCASCGQRIDREDQFCRRCGKAIPQQPLQSTATLARPVLRPPAPPAEEASNAPLPEPEPNRFAYDEPTPAEMRREDAIPESQSSAASSWLSSGPAENAGTPPLAGYVERRKSRLPVLEILIAALLIIGAIVAVWLTRSGLPKKSAVPTSSVEVTVSPQSAQVAAGKAYDLSATVSGTDDIDVDWSVQEDGGGRVLNRGAKAQDHSVTLHAVYIAPNTPGTYHVLATSKADPQKSASAEITVTPARRR